MYERAVERLEASGLRQYEISNFARPGLESRHNLRYWQRRPYLGVGLDASSMLRAAPSAESSWQCTQPRDVFRATTTGDLKTYLAGPLTPEIARIAPAQQLEEAWFLGLRTNQGVEVAALEQEFGRESVAPAMDNVTRLVADGLLTFNGRRLRLTARGRLISNDVFQEFLELAPAATA